jgi:two-component system, response regulator
LTEKLILLVENNPDDEMLTLLAFRKNKGKSHVMVCHDGAEALDYLFGSGKHAHRDTTTMPDIILLDLMLPKLHGLDVLKEIRQHPRTQRIPVIIFSSSLEARDLINAYDLGANSYIRKPLDLGKLIEIVRELELYWFTMNQPAPL